MSILVSNKERALTHNDRCDRCGVDTYNRGIAQAYVKATMKNGLELFFCNHHGTQYIQALKDNTIDIIDEREFII